MSNFKIYNNLKFPEQPKAVISEKLKDKISVVTLDNYNEYIRNGNDLLNKFLNNGNKNKEVLIEATRSFFSAIRLNPKYAEPYFKIACLYYLFNDLNKASKYLKATLIIDQNFLGAVNLQNKISESALLDNKVTFNFPERVKGI